MHSLDQFRQIDWNVYTRRTGEGVVEMLVAGLPHNGPAIEQEA
jgi:hypothetical protein